MKRLPILAWGLLAVLASPAAAQKVLTGTPEQAAPVSGPPRDIGFDQNIGRPLPLDTPFKDETGKDVLLGDYFGRKPVVLSLAYHECPMLCGMGQNGLANSLKAVTLEPGTDFEIITLSFNPEETPELAASKKREYVARLGRPGAEAGWHFLTGTEENIRKITKAAGFRYAYDAEQQQYAHAAGIILLTPQGKVSRYLFGVEYAPRDLRLGLVESGEGKLGGIVDQLILLCFHYDPKLGKYGAVAVNVMQAGGALTVLSLGAFLVVMIRREKRGDPIRRGERS